MKQKTEKKALKTFTITYNYHGRTCRVSVKARDEKDAEYVRKQIGAGTVRGELIARIIFGGEGEERAKDIEDFLCTS